MPLVWVTKCSRRPLCADRATSAHDPASGVVGNGHAQKVLVGAPLTWVCHFIPAVRGVQDCATPAHYPAVLLVGKLYAIEVLAGTIGLG